MAANENFSGKHRVGVICINDNSLILDIALKTFLVVGVKKRYGCHCNENNVLTMKSLLSK